MTRLRFLAISAVRAGIEIVMVGSVPIGWASEPSGHLPRPAASQRQSAETPVNQQQRDQTNEPSEKAAPATVEQWMQMLDEAVALDDYEEASRLLKSASAAAARTRSKELVQLIDSRKKTVIGLQREFERIRPFAERLLRDEDDPEGNLELGGFYCFWKGDWPRGLPMLARATDETLRKLAELELSGAESSDDQHRLADVWWSVADTKKGSERTNLREHARQWYEQCLERLEGPEKARVEQRLKELQPLERRDRNRQRVPNQPRPGPAARNAAGPNAPQQPPGANAAQPPAGPFYTVTTFPARWGNQARLIFTVHNTPVGDQSFEHQLQPGAAVVSGTIIMSRQGLTCEVKFFYNALSNAGRVEYLRFQGKRIPSANGR